MAIAHFKVVSPGVTTLTRDNYRVADTTLLQPNNANPLTQGEWLQLNASNQLIRGDGSIIEFPLFDETGRTDIQGAGKVTVITSMGYTAETHVFDLAGAPALGAALEVATVSNADQDLTSKSGLQTHSGGALMLVGRVLRTAAANNGYLKFYCLLA